MGHKPIWRPLRSDFFRSLAEGERLALSENVGQKYVVVAAEWIERLAERNEVARDEPRSLMDQLVERMLAVCPWFAPIYLASLNCNFGSIERNMLAIAFHGQL